MHTAEQQVDLCDEFERQFFGDVMLFSVDRLMAMGEVTWAAFRAGIAAVRIPSRTICAAGTASSSPRWSERLGQLRALLHDPQQWWRLGQVEPAALRSFEFHRQCLAQFWCCFTVSRLPEDVARRDEWRNRQLDAIVNLNADREAWEAALQRLRNQASP